ncbi:MAG TPA: ABC transporter permease [Chloroflexota bacterium]|nr:ABC transporter permease [Chloroflexota bacterium]
MHQVDAGSAPLTVSAPVDAGRAASPEPVHRRRSWLRGLLRQRLALTGLLIVAIYVVVAIVGGWIAPFSFSAQHVPDRLKPPGGAYLLGTDEFGRDILSRLLFGAGISFQVGVIAVGISGIAGVLLGLLAGYVGGWLDAVLTLIMDVVFAFPAVLLAIAIIAMLGSSLANVMLAIGVVNTPVFMRVVRGSTLSLHQATYVEAAVSLGASTPRVLARHIFPNLTAPLIVLASLNFAFAVLTEASLSFLGLGNKPPSPSWGSMVSSSYGFLEIAPWAALFPGLAIALAVLGFNLLGDGLRDALDPRLRF